FITDWHVYEEEYEATLRELVAETKPHVQGLVLMSPFYIEKNENDAMRAKMDVYGRIAKKIAEEQGAIYVDTQAVFNRLLEHLYAATLAWDRVHPTPPGHMAIARSFLTAIGFD